MSSATAEWASGDELTIEVPGAPGRWTAAVVRVSGESLHLRLSDDGSALPLPLEAGTRVDLHRMTPHGPVTAKTTLNRAFVGRGPYVSVQRPEPSAVVQRRALFRMPTALPLTIQLKQIAREDWISARVYHHLTADASGSGCSIETELPIEPGDRLRVTLWPDRPHAVVAGARVVWTGPSDWPGLKRAGLVFTTISTTGQDRLVGTLLEEERVRRRVLMDA